MNHIRNFEPPPATKQGNAYTIAYVSLSRQQVFHPRIPCLTWSLRCICHDPHKEVLPKHKHTSFVTGSNDNVFKVVKHQVRFQLVKLVLVGVNMGTNGITDPEVKLNPNLGDGDN